MNSILTTLNLTEADAIAIPFVMVLLTVILVLLQKYFFGPLVALAIARENVTTGAQGSAKELEAEAERIEQECETKLMDERVQALTKKIAVTNEAKANAAKLLEDAKHASEKELADGRAQIATQFEKLRTTVGQDVASMADSIIEKVLHPTSQVH